MEVFEPAGLSVLDVENLRLHYARTLEHWQARYEGGGGPSSPCSDCSRVGLAPVSVRLPGGLPAAGICSCSRSCSSAMGDNAIPDPGLLTTGR